MAILTVKQLAKIYEGKVAYKALENINFSIERVNLLGLWVHQGVGKRPC